MVHDFVNCFFFYLAAHCDAPSPVGRMVSYCTSSCTQQFKVVLISYQVFHKFLCENDNYSVDKIQL